MTYKHARPEKIARRLCCKWRAVHVNGEESLREQPLKIPKSSETYNLAPHGPRASARGVGWGRPARPSRLVQAISPRQATETNEVF